MILPIKWTDQHAGINRRRRNDGMYGHVDGSLLFFIYHTSQPYYGKSWRSRSWDSTSNKPYIGNELVRFRSTWNVWFYFGSGEGKRVCRTLKSLRHAKRAARLVLVKKIKAMHHE